MDIMDYTALNENEIQAIKDKTLEAPEGWVVVAGTYKGGDAMATRLVDSERELLVIDSFEGLSIPTEEDSCENEMMRGAFDNGGVEEYIRGFRDMKLREPDELQKMWISRDTITQISMRKVAFVWLDLDLYTPTIACLRHFASMMVPGGIMMTHDYKFEQTPGIEKACTEFGGEWERVIYNIFEQRF